MNTEEWVPRKCVLTLILIFLAALIDGLDASIVNVSLPTMANEFHVSLTDSSWVIFTYVVGLAAFLFPLGKMAKNNRVKKFMMLGTALFGVSSLMCGLSDVYWVLILFRTVQGMSAAMMSSVLPSMVVHMLPADRKGLGMSVMGASTGLALILGPFVGGAITTYLTWNWLFFINVPICVIILFLAAYHLPKDEAPDREKDPSILGGIAMMLLIGSLLVMLEDLGDPDINTIGRIICGALALVSVFILVRSIKTDSKKAILSPSVIKNKEYIVVGIAFLLCTIVVSGASYLLPYMLQGYWGLNSMDSGVYLAVASVAMMIFVIPVGRMCDKFGCKWPSAMAPILRGAFCIIISIMVIHETDVIFVAIPLFIYGMSHAFSGTAQPTRMIHHSTPGYEDESTNFMLVINYVASALGCALFAMLFGLFSKTGDLLQLTPHELREGFLPTMIFSVVLLFIALLCTLSVRNIVVKKEEE